jgi:cyclic pyranopterin phosphate synthase
MTHKTSLTHFNDAGVARMVDVGHKESTERQAIAEGYIMMRPQTLQLIEQGGHQKGDVLGVARIGGIMASKKTSELIPLCHPVALTHVDLALEPQPGQQRVRCQATVRTRGQTGVEMEALTAVQVALLTIYDMCKGVDRDMTIEGVRLLEKSGGKTGYWARKG